MQNRNGCRDINNRPRRNYYIRNEDGCRQNNTVKGKGDDMSNNLSDKEETVDHIKLHPERNFLHNKK